VSYVWASAFGINVLRRPAIVIYESKDKPGGVSISSSSHLIFRVTCGRNPAFHEVKRPSKPALATPEPSPDAENMNDYAWSGPPLEHTRPLESRSKGPDAVSGPGKRGELGVLPRCGQKFVNDTFKTTIGRTKCLHRHPGKIDN